MIFSYRIELWFTCKDQATMDSASTKVLTMLRTEKDKGNILDGKITKRTTESPETVETYEGV